MMDQSTCQIGQYYKVQTPSRCYKCITNPSSSNTSTFLQYDTLKQIQNTVRVPSSLYTHDLAAITATPTNIHPWNNMSDRSEPHTQRRANSMILSTYRPGSLSPGGVGCDIKHGSYARYLNRLKGKSALRKDPLPNTFGTPILFNCARPIYGNKQVKTSIISCPACKTSTNTPSYTTDVAYYYQPYVFTVGQLVAVLHPITQRMVQGTITANIPNTNEYIVFTDPETIQVNSIDMYLVKC